MASGRLTAPKEKRRSRTNDSKKNETNKQKKESSQAIEAARPTATESIAAAMGSCELPACRKTALAMAERHL